MESFLYDFRTALRGLRRSWGYTSAAVAMLALAIGLNVTVSTVMDAMLFRGFPLVKNNDRLLYMQERYPSGVCCLSYPDFEAWRSQARAFSGMAFIAGRAITLSERSARPFDTFTATMSANAFRVLGVSPRLGRDFLPSDEAPGAPPVAILSYHFWTSHFSKRPDIVGLTVRIDQKPATIIGVMPDGFDFPEQQNLWMPLAHTPELLQRGPGGYMAFGRIRDGVSVQEARAELQTINRRLEAEFPATNRGVTPRVDTYSQFFVGPDAPVVYGSLWVAAWFVMLIGCADLANLTLARTIERWREFSTRIALGAGQARMMRQILLENLALASVAAALGWCITLWGVRVWAVATASSYQILDYKIDSATLAYLVAISLGAAVLSSLAPMTRVWKLGLSGVLKSEARGVTQGPRGKRLAATLVACQMALAVVLLSGSGILLRSLWNVVKARTGVRDAQKVMVALIHLPSEKYPSAARQLAYFDDLDAKLRTIPEVQSASVSPSIPVGSGDLKTFEIEGQAAARDDQAAQFISAGSDYFRVMGAPAIAGREFNDQDRPSAPPVAMVNQSFADRFWPGQPALGRRIRAKGSRNSTEWLTVVGVAPNIMQGDPIRQAFKPVIYVPFRQSPAGTAFLFLRTAVPLDSVAAAVRAAIQNSDPDAALREFSTLQATFGFDRDRMDLEHAEMGKHAAVAPLFAIIALLLAAVGLYAVIAHSVGQRTREIGVRMAIGATAGHIRRMILRDGLLPVAIGTIVGLAASLAVNRVLQSQLVGVLPYDPATLSAAPALLALVALLACQLPARRAMRVDPAVALRHD